MVSVIPKISQLSPRIIRVLGCNPGPMTLQGTNTYVIGTGKRRILVDTGDCGISEYISSLGDVLKTNNIELQDIIITHWHNDHIGGVNDIIRELGTFMKTCTISKFARGTEPDPPLTLNKHFSYLNDKQQFFVDGASLTVVHTPGHTDDHAILVLEEENAVFSGDCILGEGSAVFEDLHSYMKSLNTILKLTPALIYPGHGPIVENGVQKIQEYINHRLAREKEILNVMQSVPIQSYTAMDLVKLIYKDTPSHLHGAAAYNVSHHLAKLKKDGVVENLKEEKWRIVKQNDQPSNL